MNNLIAFFEIPSSDFGRAVSFYKAVFNTELQVFDRGEEKMAFFNDEGAISYTPGFTPSAGGVLIHFNCSDINGTLETVKRNNGKTIIPKTKIEAENRGYFAVFSDSEGNHIGIYSDK